MSLIASVPFTAYLAMARLRIKPWYATMASDDVEKLTDKFKLII